MLTPKVNQNESSEAEISFNKMTIPDKKSDIYNPFIPGQIKQVIEDMDSQVKMDAKMKEVSLAMSSLESQSINKGFPRQARDFAVESETKSTDLEPILPHYNHEKNGILKLINNHVVLLLTLAQKMHATGEYPDCRLCLSCLRRNPSTRHCRLFGMFNRPEFSSFLKELAQVPDSPRPPETDSGLAVDLTVLRHFDFLLNTSCRLDSFGLSVQKIASLMCAQATRPGKKGRRSASASKKWGIQSRLGSRKRARLRSHSLNKYGIKFNKIGRKSNLKKNFSKNKANPGATGKQFSTRLIKWCMARRFTEYTKAVDLRVPLPSVQAFGEHLFRGRFNRSNIVLIDCRYKYEFEGGYLLNSINVIDPEVIKELFFGHDWIGDKDFFQHVRGFANQRIDIDLARTILRRFQTSRMLDDNQSIESRLKKMKSGQG